MRKELAALLDGIAIFDAYLWEREGASTLRAAENYIGELNDSDICVFVIDNKEGVTPGVQKEIDQVFNTKKRALFYFVTEFSQEETELQKQLKGPGGCTYREVSAMADVPACVVEDFQYEILRLFRRWCNYDVDYVCDSSGKASVDGSALVPKSALSAFPGLREFFGQFLFGTGTGAEADPGLDGESVKLAKSLYIDFDADKFDPSGFFSVAEAMLPSGYSDLVKGRWAAIRLYFMGDAKAALSSLETVLEDARALSAEPWFIDDILIDLRNIYPEAEDDWLMESKYQKELGESDREVVFPLLDRAESNAMGEIEDDRIKKGIEGYSTITIGENALRFFDPVCESFAVAALFGSLTHISRTLLRLRKVVFYLRERFRDANLNAALLKLTIVLGKQSDAENTLQAFNNVCFDSDSHSAWEVFDFCSRYKCLGARTAVNLFKAFGTMGIYLSDSDFAKASAMFLQAVERELADPQGWADRPKAVFDAISRNETRLSKSWAVDCAVRALSIGKIGWRDESLRWLSRCRLSFEDISENLFTRLIDGLGILLTSDESDEVGDKVCSVLLHIAGSSSADRYKSIDEVAYKLPEKSLERFRACFRPEGRDEYLALMVRDDIEQIKELNSQQGKNGCYARGIDYHASASIRLAAIKVPPLSLGRDLYLACLGTVASPTFDLGGKISACKSMCELAVRFGSRSYGDPSCTDEALSSEHFYAEGFLLGKESRLLLKIWSDVLRLLVGLPSGEALQGDVVECYRVDVYTQAHAGDAFGFLVGAGRLRGKTRALMGALFSYAGYLIESEHFQLNLRGLELMALFLGDKELRGAASRSLARNYDGQSPMGKQVVIDSIAKIREFDQGLASTLRAKVLRDNTTTAVAYLKRVEEGQG